MNALLGVGWGVVSEHSKTTPIYIYIIRDRIYVHEKSSKYASKNAVICYKMCIYYKLFTYN